jgi:hypothetical protein
MLSFCFRFSSHLIEKRPFCCRTFHEGFVSSTDAMISRQAGRFSEPTACIRRITCGLLLRSALSGNSTALNSLQFDVWVFGIAYLNIALFEMALRQFVCMCCICGRTTTKWMLAYLKAFVTYLKAYVSSKYSDWQSMKSMTVSSMECVTQRRRSHLEHLGTAWDLQLVHCFAQVCQRFHACPR